MATALQQTRAIALIAGICTYFVCVGRLPLERTLADESSSSQKLVAPACVPPVFTAAHAPEFFLRKGEFHMRWEAVPQDAVEGSGQTQVYSLAKLDQDALERAVEGFDWKRGAHGHTLSLPRRDQLDDEWQDHLNNVPYAGVLDKCPYFTKIFDEINTKTKVIRFAILRREGASLYGLHHDRDMGENFVRVQVPIQTNDEVRLIVTDHRNYDGAHEFMVGEPFQDPDINIVESAATIKLSQMTKDALRAGIKPEFVSAWFKARAWGDLLKFLVKNKSKSQTFKLKPGVLYSFNAKNTHSLINMGEEDRYTLLVDFKKNDWVLKQLFKNRDPSTI